MWGFIEFCLATIGLCCIITVLLFGHFEHKTLGLEYTGPYYGGEK